LKYSTGYNHAFLPENEVSSLDMSPHYAQLGVSIDHIANNFSFVFILQLLALVSVLVTVVRLRTFNKNNPNVNALSKKELYD
jgi:hypothetical protein